MALLTAQVVGVGGTIPSYTAVNSSDTFTPAANRLLHVKNTNAATRLITITTTQTGVGGLAVADYTHTIAATTGDVMLPAGPAQALADPSTGLATVTYSATPGVTAALIENPSLTGA